MNVPIHFSIELGQCRTYVEVNMGDDNYSPFVSVGYDNDGTQLGELIVQAMGTLQATSIIPTSSRSGSTERGRVSFSERTGY
jgi:hypothetical protein